MCHDPGYIGQLQDDHEHFTSLAELGDEAAARSADATAIELQMLGARPLRTPRPLYLAADSRFEAVERPRTRMGLGDVSLD